MIHYAWKDDSARKYAKINLNELVSLYYYKKRKYQCFRSHVAGSFTTEKKVE